MEHVGIQISTACTLALADSMRLPESSGPPLRRKLRCGYERAQRKRDSVGQIMASLFVTCLLLGYKLGCFNEIVRLRNRKRELTHLRDLQQAELDKRDQAIRDWLAVLPDMSAAVNRGSLNADTREKLVGVCVNHSAHGQGRIVEISRFESRGKPVLIQFDKGEMHSYSWESLMKKVTVLADQTAPPSEFSVAAASVVRTQTVKTGVKQSKQKADESLGKLARRFSFMSFRNESHAPFPLKSEVGSAGPALGIASATANSEEAPCLDPSAAAAAAPSESTNPFPRLCLHAPNRKRLRATERSTHTRSPVPPCTRSRTHPCTRFCVLLCLHTLWHSMRA